MQHAIGISVHTGWGACVVVGGSLRRPEIIGNKVIELLGDGERFCYHRASEMKTYYFCMESHKSLFDSNPESFMTA